jgi:hypothetical protein
LQSASDSAGLSVHQPQTEREAALAAGESSQHEFDLRMEFQAGAFNVRRSGLGESPEKERERDMIRTISAFVAVGLAGVALAQPSSNFINFDGYSLGNVPGSFAGDTRTAGGPDWWQPGNSSASSAVQAGVGLGGSQGLMVGNNGNGNDGVIQNLLSPRLSTNAGESVAPANGQNTTMFASYWFRTAPTSNPSSYYSFASEMWGPDRNSFFGVDNFNPGRLTAYVTGYDASGTGVLNEFIDLQWGQWYRVTQTLQFVDGPGNDIFSVQIFDTMGGLVGQSGNYVSWEEGQRQQGFNAGNIFSTDSIGFQTRFSEVGATAYVDDLFYAAVPAPGAAAVMGLGLVVAGRRRR